MSDPVSQASDAQSRASDPRVSAWVSASAGSGKTRVLVDRVVRLMLAGTPPERILCLTFTRAAAAEMSNRLFQTLSTWIGLDDDTLSERIQRLTREVPSEFGLIEARRLFTRALETPGGLKIQTIHAFCEKLLQRFPVEAGIVPGFEVMDDRTADELLAEIRNGFLLEVGEHPDSLLAESFAKVVSYVGADSFDRVLKELLASRVQLTRLLDPARFRDAMARLSAFLGLGEGDRLESVIRAFAEGLPRAGLFHAREVLAGGTKSMVEQSDRLATLLATTDPDEAFDLAAKVLLTGKGERKAESSLISKKLAQAHPDVLELLRAEQDRLCAAIERQRAVHVRDATQALLLIALRMLGEYEAAKRKLGQYDYEDLIERTLTMFTGQASAGWVLYKLDGGIDHILIDEAQDTSPPQWRIIATLAEEFFSGDGARPDPHRTLFVVGDHKQSIYSFQGADPQVFEDMHRAFRQRISESGRHFEDVPLSVSFRSTGDVLRAVDWVFEQSEAQAGIVPRDGEFRPHQPVRIGDAGLVEIWEKERPVEKPPTPVWDAPVDHEDAAHPRVRLAERIAATIHRWLETGEPLTALGRPIRPGDILVLVRRRDRFVEALLRGLKQRGVPVAGADRLVLTEHIAVMDLIALGRFLLLPEDDLNLACLLKSPLLARDDGRSLDDDDLIAICHDRPGSLWSALQQRVADGAPYSRALRRLTEWLNRADFRAPFAFFSEVLAADGGRRAFARRMGDEVHDPLDEFLAACLDYEQRHTPSLQGFLHWLLAAETSIKRDMEHGVDAVRIMTVHGSKGLEANIVFLPDTCSPPRKQNDPAILRVPGGSEGDTIHFWRIGTAYEGSAVCKLREREQQAQREEYNRLLYVAMTRARDRLYICGYEGKRETEGTWYDVMINALCERAQVIERPDGSRIWRIESPQQRLVQPEAATETAAPPPALPAWAATPAPAEAPTRIDLAPSHLVFDEDQLPLSIDAEPPAISPVVIAADSSRFRRGRLIHKLLEALPQLAPDRREAAAERYLERAAPDYDAETRAAIWQEVAQVLHHPDFAEVFAEGSLSEVPVSALAGGGAARVTGRIDRMAITEDEVLIVDFKTNRPPPARLEDVPAAYLHQVRAYASMLSGVFPGRRIRAALLWTVDARLMEVPAPEAPHATTVASL